MRMRKKKNLVPRMERCAAQLIRDPYEHRGHWRDLMPQARELRLEKWYDPVLILALGKPNERIFLDYINRTDATAFYRDREGYLHIPKRRLEDVILPFEPKD